MKFRFLGGGDCPDWLLAALYELSSFSEEKIGGFCDYMAKHPKGGLIDEKVLLGILTDTETNSIPTFTTLKVLAECVSYILSTSHRLNVPGDVLLAELQQLGLPRSHAVHLRKAAEYRPADYTVEALDGFFRISKLIDVSAKEPTDSRVVDCVEVNLNVENGLSNEKRLHQLLIQKHDLPELIQELKKVKDRMEELQLS